MKPTQLEYVVFDVETTGLFPKTGDRIIEIAAVKVKNGKRMDTMESFVNPQRDIPDEAQRINQITPAMVADAPLASEVLPGMIPFIAGATLVAHNIKFDLDFLCYELSLCQRKLNGNTPTLDTLKMAKAFLPHLSSYRLGSVAQYFGLKIEGTHRALADTELTVSVMMRLLEISEKQGIVTLEELFKQFGVDKPSFPIDQVNQGSLF